MLKLGSLFDGIGGFCLSAKRNCINPEWASEINTDCISITKRHFPQMVHLGDITKISGYDVTPTDIVTFGSPCQDLSIAGKHAGLKGTRSVLFYDAIRIINEMREATNGRNPTWVIWENVPAALSSSDGMDFRAVLKSLANAEIPMPNSGRWAGSGMVRGRRCEIGWRILDAQYWGVPQRRRRIFLVADFRGKYASEVLFKPESLRGNFTQNSEIKTGFATNIRGCTIAASKDSKRQPADDSKIYPQTIGALVKSTGNMPIVYACTMSNTTGNGFGICTDTAYTLDQTTSRQAIMSSGRSISGPIMRNSGEKQFTNNQDVSGGEYFVLNGQKLRRLTPLECERLMGFPDGWTEYGADGRHIADAKRYAALGNSVAIPCVDFVMRGIAFCK
jgi:DNA (cytosine-5)-methyltransferase 1